MNTSVESAYNQSNRETIGKSLWPADLQGYSIGNDCRLYVSFDKGRNFNEIDVVRDVTLNQQTSSIETSCKKTGFVKTEVPHLIELSVSAEALFDVNETLYQQLASAFRSRRIFYLTVHSDSGEGPTFRAFIASFNRSEPLYDVVKVNVEFRLSSFVGWTKSEVDAFVDNQLVDHTPTPA